MQNYLLIIILFICITTVNLLWPTMYMSNSYHYTTIDFQRVEALPHVSLKVLCTEPRIEV